MSTADRYDAIVIGGGHNGLVAAAYLAKAGKRVLLLEAGDRLGGMAGARDIGGGLSVATATTLGMLSPQVVKDLRLAGHGLRYRHDALETLALGEPGQRIRIVPGDPSATAESVGRLSPYDAQRLPAFQDRLARLSGALRGFNGRTPPRLKLDDWRERMRLLHLGWSIRRLGRADMRDLLRILPMNVADLAEEVFESDLMRGLVSFDAVLGNMFGPRSPNTVFTLLYRWAGEVEGRRGVYAVAEGGTQQVIEAIAAAARACGAEIRIGARVERISAEDGRVSGVVTTDGEEIRAAQVLSSAHPRRTLLDMVGVEHLDADFVRQMRFIRSNGATARVDMVLAAPPDLGGDAGDPLATRLVIAPSIASLERAFDVAKYGGFSETPPLQTVLSGTGDGRYVLSATVQYAPSRVAGEDWAALKPRLEQQTVAVLDAHLPGLAGKIEGVASLTPAEIEERWDAPGAHWHHVETGIDQAFLMRPVPGWAQYTTPIDGLLLCGAGSHPGGWITGQPGANAARRALELLKAGDKR